MAKLESKVRELEKQQVTILATPLPEESKRNPGSRTPARWIMGDVVLYRCWPGVGLVLVCGGGCGLEVLAFSHLGMKQGLQNLREEIKQLGREVRAQLKGE